MLRRTTTSIAAPPWALSYAFALLLLLVPLGCGEGSAEQACVPGESDAATNTGSTDTAPAPTGPCPQDWQPVCGDDGETYATACIAQRAGRSVAADGPCAGTPRWWDAGPTDTGASDAGGTDVGSPDAGDPDAGSTDAGGTDVVGQSCGGILGTLCQKGTFCDPDGCFPGAAGTCQIVPGGLCPMPLPGGEVCGCDGKTYAGDCERRMAQVGKAKEGACEP